MPPVDPGPVPLVAYRDWPGLDPSGHIKVDHAQVRAIAARLTAHLEDLLSADEDLKPASSTAYGAWDAAQRFYPSVQDGHATLVDQHSRFLHAMLDMIKKLHRTAQTYDATEAELERRIAAVDKRLQVVPTTDLLQHDSSSAPPGAAVPNSLNPEGRD
ncbi:hypothetical protein GCM10027176_78560 [Actinoallomurus bryophytorum]